jgi:hypothetical protein
MPYGAGVTFAAINIRLKNNPVTNSKGFFIFRHFNNLTGNFMTNNPWIGDKRIGAVVSTNIGTANTCTADSNQDLLLTSLCFSISAILISPGFCKRTAFMGTHS